MEFVWTDDQGPSVFEPGGVLLSSFPSAGFATTVAAHYMIQTLGLPRIGRFESPDGIPIAVIQSGVVNPPVRVYGRKDLAVVISEFPPSISQAKALARTIFQGAEGRRARLIVCMEGVMPHPLDEGTEVETPEEQVWVAFSRKDADLLNAFQPTRARLLEDGIIGGVSGALLVHGIDRKPPVAAMLVSARASEGYPDHRAGASLIEAIDSLLPELRIDTGPLRTQAEQIERALRNAMRSQARTVDRETEPSQATTMYG